jgi:beta-barrel assembly-enhancing protease
VRYENPELPEGINNSDTRPLATFLRLSGALLLLCAVLGGTLVLLADRLVPLVPFRYEKAVAEGAVVRDPADAPIENYLQELAGRLARAQPLPPDISVQVHYSGGAMVNAFATLGGHVVIYQGLLETVPDENALAMVLAHEIAHRHPIASAGRAAALGFALMLIGADSGASVVQSAVSQGGALTMLSFSRSQESEADATALEAVYRTYGHVGGADAFFRAMLKRAGAASPPAFLSSHPLTAGRIEALAAHAAQRGWKADGARTPLPPTVRAERSRLLRRSHRRGPLVRVLRRQAAGRARPARAPERRPALPRAPGFRPPAVV